jgi:hypothetical protein
MEICALCAIPWAKSHSIDQVIDAAVVAESCMTVLALAAAEQRSKPEFRGVLEPTAIFVRGETTPRGPLVGLAPA